MDQDVAIPQQPGDEPGEWPPGDGLMARRVRGHDWWRSALGPIAGWPEALRSAVGKVLAAPQPMWIGWGPDFLQIHNDAFAGLLDEPRRSAALGRPARETWAEAWPVLAPDLEGVLAGGPPVLRLDGPAPGRPVGRSDGTRVPFSLSPVPDPAAPGGVGGVIWLGAVAAPPRDRPGREAFLLALADALWPIDDPLAVPEVAMRALGGHLDTDHAAFGELGTDGGLAFAPGHRAPGIEPPALPLLEELGPAYLADLRGGRGVAVPDAAALTGEAGATGAALLRRGLGALLMAPVVRHGRLVAVAALLQRRPRAWTADEIALAGDVARRTSDAVHRARAQSLLREAEARHRASADTLAFTQEAFGAAPYDSDMVTGAVAASPQLNALYGYPPDHPLTVGDCVARIHPDDVAAVASIFSAAGPGGGPFQREFRIRLPDGATRWVLSRGVVQSDGAGRPVRARGAAIDITDRKRAEERLRDSEGRLSAIFANASVGLSEVALDGSVLQVNEELCRLLDRSRDELLGMNVVDVTHPEDRARTQEAVAGLLAGAGVLALDKRYLRPDGAVIWANSRGTLLRHGEGRPDTMLVVTVDLTARREAEAALRDSEARFRQFGDTSGDVLWIRDARTLEFDYVSPAFEEIYGARLDTVQGPHAIRRWAELILPEDRGGALDHLRRVREGEHVLHAFRILRADGVVRWIRDTSFPLVDENGRVTRLGGIYHDATEEVDLQDRLRVLVAELQHRSRNLIGVVRTVSERTLATSATLDEFRSRFRARLDALGRVNALLSRLEEGERITFDQLLRTELSAHGVLDEGGQGGQVRLSGPPGVPLRSATVQTFALALHELATNALKHGALTRPEGRLEVGWDLIAARGGDRRLRVEWRESGVATAEAARTRQGYGRELIERALPYQLKAQTSYELTPGGVRCTITVPVSLTLDLAFSNH